MRGGLAAMLGCDLTGAAPAYADHGGDNPKLDKALNELASRGNGSGLVQVIILLKPGWNADVEATRLGGKLGRSLNSINGKVVQLPKGQLKKLADYPGVDRIVFDRPTAGEMNRVAVTVGARAVQQTYGYRGAGIGIAVIDSGIVVVTAAGNLGKNSLGQTQYGAIGAPGNAPWVITVGAYSHEGTVVRTDDVMAGFSSRGPSAFDYEAKPDIVAPGVGTVSLSDPGGLMYLDKPTALLGGSLLDCALPSFSLAGPSIAV